MVPQDSTTDVNKALLEAAREAARHAHAPYSNFPVGAALLTDSGEIITGVNIENASYGMTVCAERVALWKAVSEGKKNFKAIAVWAENNPNGSVSPCGACRQVMAEFALGDFAVVMADEETPDKAVVFPLASLLPRAFTR